MRAALSLLVLLNGPLAAAQNEAPDAGDPTHELTFVLGLNGGVGFLGSASASDPRLSGNLTPSPLLQGYAEFWFLKWLGAGLLVDNSWVNDERCSSCASTHWLAFAVHGVLGLMLFENVGLALRVASGFAIAQKPGPVATTGGEPGFFVGAWGLLRWLVVPYVALVVGLGLVRQSAKLGTAEASDPELEQWLVEGRAHFGAELVY